MTTPTTYEQFVAQVTESSLLSAEDITVVINGVPKDRRPKDGEQLARELVRQNKLTVYQAQQVYAGKGKELVRGNYVILDKLGKGGMGVVYKAEHKRMRRQVALKVLSPQATKSPEAVKRFHREVEAAAKLNHPNIVAAYDADEFNGTHFLVMEYVEGDDLSNTVKKHGPLPIDKAVSYMLQAARGLEFAHQRGVIHRDIKPANMLLDANGNVKVLDMGLARFESDVAGEAELTSTGQVMGTVDYMAPEQALSTKQADQRSDIYSLGMSLWFLLTGHSAYGGDSLMARMLAHREQPIPSLCASRKDAPKQLDAIFAKMIAKNAKDRYQSMSEVAAALETCRPGSVERTQPQVQRDEDKYLGAVLREQTRPSQMKLPVAQPLTPEKPAKSIVGAKPPAAHAAPPDARPPVAHAVVTAAGSAPAKAAPPPARSKTNVLSVEETMNTGAPSGNTDSQLNRLFNVAAPSPLPTSITKKRSQPSWQDPRVLLIGGIGLAMVAGLLLLAVAAIAFLTPSPTTEVVENSDVVPQNHVENSGTSNVDATSLPPASTLSVVALKEFGTGEYLMSPWPSSDGLRLYFEGPTTQTLAGHGVLMAERVSVSGTFGTPKFLVDMRHPCLTDDELVMVGISHLTPATMLSSRRISRAATFAAPEPLFPNHPEAGERHNVKSPFIGPDGRVLLFQRTASPGATEFMVTRRAQARDVRWERPDFVPLFNERARGLPPTWPWLSADGLLTVWSHGGDRAAQIWTARRSRLGSDFANFAPVIVDGAPLVGRSPRWCEKTGELFFSQPVGDRTWQLAVLKDFWPQGKPASAITPPPTITTPPNGYAALFNGRDLSGWEVMQTTGSDSNEQTDHRVSSGGWDVNGGVLKCATAVPGWLKTNKQYQNFELRLEYRLPLTTSNSGIYIRSPDTGHLSRVGMEVQIVSNAAATAGENAGSIHRAAAGTRNDLAVGQWNVMTITCNGDAVEVMLNGSRVAQTNMATNAMLRDRPRQGYIGLANWMGQAQGVEFRNIWLKELPATSTSTPTPVATGTAKFNGHEYKFFADVLSWKEARAKCVAEGGDLVVIDSLEENTFVAGLVSAGGALDCWVGATDEASEGTWLSPTGKPLTFLNWAQGQPNNKNQNEHFAVMTNRTLGGRAYNWAWCDQPDDALAEHQPGYVCEWSNSPSVPAVVPAADGWVDLLNGRDFTGWTMLDGKPATWKAQDGYIEITTGHLRTEQEFGPDFELKAEFWIPSQPTRSGQARGNSGIFLIGRHEVQIVDAYNNNVGGPDKTCGSVFGVAGVTADAIQPPETWQTFHIRYQAPRWDGRTLQTPGRVTVIHNGKEVVSNAPISQTSMAGPIATPGSRGPIVLQDHGSPVRFRNLRIRESDAAADVGWIDLFNGRDLTGWQEFVTRGQWSARNGSIFTTGGTGGGWLATEKQFGNFELELEYRQLANSNSGVFLRIPDDGMASGGDFLEVQIVSNSGGLAALQRTGALFRVIPAAISPITPAATWHRVKVRAVGSQITTWINDEQVALGDVDAAVVSGTPMAHIRRQIGRIGLQRHTTPVEFRKIRIREL